MKLILLGTAIFLLLTGVCVAKDIEVNHLPLCPAKPKQASGGTVSGTYPGSPFNGMQITYSFNGGACGKPVDKPGFTTARHYEGVLGAGTMTLSGSVKQDWGYGASVRVDLWAGKEKRKFNAKFKKGESRSFNLTLQVPKGAGSGGFRVDMTGEYNAGGRGLVVSGSLQGEEKKDLIKDSSVTKNATLKVTACPADPSGQGALIPNWPGFPARFDIKVEGDGWKRLRWKQSDEDEAHEMALDVPWIEIMAYDNGADDKQPTRKVDKTITVEVLDDEGKVLDSKTLPYRVGLGLAYTHAKLMLVDTEPSRLTTHALVLSVASNLRPGLDVGAWFEGYDTCRQGHELANLQPDIKVNMRPEVLIDPNEVFGDPVKLQVYRGPLAFKRLNDKEAVLVVDGIMPEKVGQGGGGPQHKFGKHRYPGVALAVTGEYSFMTALRPHVGSRKAWDFGDLTQDLFYTATFESDPSWQQLYACMFEADTTQQVVLRETLKLIPVYGSGISWGFTAFSSLCAYSKGNYDKSFLTIMKKIGEVAAEKMILSKLTKAIGEVPDLSADTKAGLTQSIQTMYKIAKADYKIWAGNNALLKPSPAPAPPAMTSQPAPADGGWQKEVGSKPVNRDTFESIGGGDTFSSGQQRGTSEGQRNIPKGHSTKYGF